MNEEVVYLQELAIVLSVLTGISLLLGILNNWNVHKARKEEPNAKRLMQIETRLEKIEQQLTAIETRREQNDRHLDQHDQTFDGLRVFQKALTQAMLAMLEHARTGDGDEMIKKAQHVLESYLTER